MYNVGTAKKEIGCFVKDIGMMGYGMYFNRVKDQKVSLYTRCVAIEKENTTLIYSCSEILGISQAVRNEVIERLKNNKLTSFLESKHIMLSAQHTHSGPGGYFHFALYNFTIPGFRKQVFEGIVE